MKASLIVFLLLPLFGCAPKAPPRGAQVQSITYDGNGGWLSARSDSALRNATAHPSPRGVWPFRSTVPYKAALLDDDADRIAVHYAHQGWFDARLVDWKTEVVREATATRPAVVSLEGVIEEGEPYTVSDVTWLGLEDLDDPLLSEKIVAASPPLESPFALRTHDAAKGLAARRLQNAGYAHAEVEGAVVVDGATKTVGLTYDVDRGPKSTFGTVTFPGEHEIPQNHLERAIPFEPGDMYRIDDLERARRQLYALGVFSIINVQPQLDDRDGTVDVVIEVEYRQPRALSAGVGLQLQNGRQEALGSLRFDHANGFGRRIGYGAELRGGYAFVGSSLADFGRSGTRSGPVVDTSAYVRLPEVGPPAWDLELEARYERTITEGYVADRPSATLGWSGPLHDHLTLTFNYRLRYNQYRDLQIDMDQLQSISPDLQDGKYFLTELQQTLLWDSRDDPLSPRQGMLHQLTLIQAGRFSGGDYDYFGGTVDLRAYPGLDARKRFTLASRLGGGVLVPYGPDERRAVPVAERFTLGGADNVRGWVYQHLGPYVCAETACATPDDPASKDNDIVPIGGQVQLHGSLELRRYGDTFGAVVFTDFGMVWQDLSTLSETPLLPPSVGVGGRVFTPAGPIRMDVAMRTDSSPRYRSEPRVWVHFGLGEAF